MHYTTVYDLTSQPALNWRSFALPFFLALAATAAAYYSRPGLGRYSLLAFALTAVLVAVVLPAWDHYQLSHQEPSTVEGLISGHWEKEWNRRRDGKNQYYHYESFQVDAVSFGYYRNVEMSGFHNAGSALISLADGLSVRIQYVREQQVDDGSLLNRIVRLEIARR